MQKERKAQYKDPTSHLPEEETIHALPVQQKVLLKNPNRMKKRSNESHETFR